MKESYMDDMRAMATQRYQKGISGEKIEEMDKMVARANTMA